MTSITTNVHASNAAATKMEAKINGSALWLDIFGRRISAGGASIFLDPRLEPQVRALAEANEALAAGATLTGEA